MSIKLWIGIIILCIITGGFGVVVAALVGAWWLWCQPDEPKEYPQDDPLTCRLNLEPDDRE